MTVPVRYYCPHCGAIVTLERDANLADKSVTADPLDGWEYENAYDDFEDADGVQIVCGASETDEDGCGELYYLNFIKFEDGEELDPHVPLRPEDAPNFDFRT
ncbi:hypothetical protein [Haladaptatus cibarius]|uniref:hypothetical protein n=1 Tax=Haladaptatus cibarius TaxID=453847 RepID=UPI000678D9E0|nr:hypothetical protein [Haladaptatus cibarius]